MFQGQVMSSPSLEILFIPICSIPTGPMKNYLDLAAYEMKASQAAVER